MLEAKTYTAVPETRLYKRDFIKLFKAAAKSGIRLSYSLHQLNERIESFDDDFFVITKYLVIDEHGILYVTDVVSSISKQATIFRKVDIHEYLGYSRTRPNKDSGSSPSATSDVKFKDLTLEDQMSLIVAYHTIGKSIWYLPSPGAEEPVCLMEPRFHPEISYEIRKVQ